ncbi:MAG: restriction endonuclease [Anaerolineae bacterium]|nr:restriction endonuclease [Anaerolineae bacterium]
MASQDAFRDSLVSYFGRLRERVTTETGDWTVKGFIDVYQRIYTITLDTKVLSKALELLMFPALVEFAQANGYQMVLARQQNQYPDISWLAPDGAKYALDIKSTYRRVVDRQGRSKVNGMTLGTYTGYFRARESASITTFPYQDYAKHYVLGVIYTQIKGIDEQRVYDIGQLADIPAVARDFDFFLYEKYRIAADRPGSGNTRNIGSTVFEERLINGTGVFASLGVEVFDDYWMNYRTMADARAEGMEYPPYRNLHEYKRYKQQGSAILAVADDQLESEVDEADEPSEDEA